MFEQDYLMRIIAQLLGAIRRSMERRMAPRSCAMMRIR